MIPTTAVPVGRSALSALGAYIKHNARSFTSESIVTYLTT